MSDRKDFEGEIYEKMRESVAKELDKLREIEEWGFEELKKLETLSKIYSTLKDDLRQDTKYGLLGKPAA